MPRITKLKIFLFSILFLFLMIISSFAFYVAGLTKEIIKQQEQGVYTQKITKEQIKYLEGVDNYFLGPKNAPISIVEFADFGCPMCKEFFSTIRELQIKNKNVKIVWRDFPVVKDYSIKLSLGAHCAGEQGLFWQMHDKLFLNQGIKTDQEIINLFKQIKGDDNKFKQCYNNKKYLPQIKKDIEDAQKLKIQGTPTIFINGLRIQGNAPYNYLQNIINSQK